ncbi:MAG: hypothetical protein AAGJ09_00005, partial [Pseudomonadota bacterium]
PLETAPHMKAHMGGNHVIGLSNSSVADGDGKRFGGAERRSREGGGTDWTDCDCDIAERLCVRSQSVN